MSQFEYRTLTPHQKRVRLVHVLPENQSSSLSASANWNQCDPHPFDPKTLVSCTISHVSLDDKPTYTALSYSWGDPSLTSPIIVDGSLIRVTRNLESALRHLRLPDQTILLWVDALCINQENNLEKSEQLEQMLPIYSQALAVVAWLGPSTANIDLAMEWIDNFGSQASKLGIGTKPDLHLRHILKAFETDKGHGIYNEQLRAFIHDLKEQFSTANPRHAILISALSEIFKRPYWDRVWVVQELVSASDAVFVCGNSRASDPRDKIFALLGIAGDAEVQGIFPDYRKACEDVYTDLARTLIQNGFIELLSLCEFPKKVDGLPSWVPDWSREVYRTPLQQRSLDRSSQTPLTTLEPRFSASGNNHKIHLIAGEVVSRDVPLLLSGILLGDVQRVGTRWEDDDVGRWLSDLHTLSQFISDAFDLTAVWQTAVADQDIRQGTRKPRLSEEKICLLRQTLKSEDLSLINSQTLIRLGLGDYCHQLCTIARGRRPISVSGTYLGIGPCDTEPGDLVFIPLGSDVPYVLRRNNEDDKLRLIGEAYLHGIMDGEGLQQSQVVETIALS
ncbi:hypothetical protein OIDMADRAFT_160053 [Oidiodendron maius Zn]|uniref:Heterokaryon incompatibility domain-containing protein n=1 Tax=Oidiodendron maius (strain Zn) TaxID=913774 RepID=A0A0C3CU88_OIDMZ|nr:hypothetical protein OIDMADRAFT_160053 [Oidiodendron maius Zn]